MVMLLLLVRILSLDVLQFGFGPNTDIENEISKAEKKLLKHGLKKWFFWRMPTLSCLVLELLQLFWKGLCRDFVPAPFVRLDGIPYNFSPQKNVQSHFFLTWKKLKQFLTMVAKLKRIHLHRETTWTYLGIFLHPKN